MSRVVAVARWVILAALAVAVIAAWAAAGAEPNEIRAIAIAWLVAFPLTLLLVGVALEGIR